jgi:arylsulfatase A-like enzyme
LSRRPPNLLLLLTDQQRFDTIAALGNRLIRTPALDRLCREGTAFTRCYTPSPVCVSARCSLVTGLPPHLTGCVDNNTPVRPGIPSFMERLAGRGYQTQGIGKMHFTPSLLRNWGFESRDVCEELNPARDDYAAFLRRNGFGHVLENHGLRSELYYVPQPSQLPARLHPTTWVADRARDFLARRDRRRPFFLWASWIKPHPPFESPYPWSKAYRCADMPPPRRVPNEDRLLAYWNRFQNRYKYKDAGEDRLLLRSMRAAYYACISFIDFNLGRILAALGDELDNTLVVFTSDHGEMLGDYGAFGKRCMLDPAVRVPLLARWPRRFPAGRRCVAPSSLLDLWPTFLAAAGDPEPRVSEEGFDLRDVLAGRARRDAVYSQYQQDGLGLYMAVSRGGKYVWSAADRREWYFDLRRDPRETVNRIADPRCAADARELRGRLLRRFREDGYLRPLSGTGWKRHPRRELPADPDAGLLRQDPAGLARALAKLGPYAPR